ncbi:MAG: LTA synthase family protein [Lachnospiraceae bacterium]|nr:LTA synthase family protein [Lachnospiraceae bacterium]
MKMIRKQKSKKLHWFSVWIGTLLFAVAAAVIAGVYWAWGQFGELDLSKIIFHLRESTEGTNWDAFTEGFVWAAVAASVCAGINLLLQRLLNKQGTLQIQVHRWKLRFHLDTFSRHYIWYSAAAVILSIVLALSYVGVPTYARNRLNKTTIYEDYYVDPVTANVTFPEKKRNLIYIYMESMETTFMSAEHGGAEYGEFIPELYQMQMDNTNFAEPGHINGAYSTYGTTWTMGGLVAQTCGVPLNLPLDGNELGYHIELLSGAGSIGQVLDAEGYRQEFLMGSAGGFGGRDSFFVRHGNYAIKDYYYAVDQEWIDPDYFVWWGYEDQKLYEYARNELLELAESGEPFNLTMLTVDTHFVGGYTCEICKDEFGDDSYANAIACGSRQVSEFVEWVKQQDFYDNTTIIICGDHPTMDEAYMQVSVGDDLRDYPRRAYTVIINGAREYELGYDRVFTTMDMCPTTLASLGAVIEGDRLGLGTDLYSTTPTLAELMGLEQLDQELARTSKYYEDYIFYNDRRK